MKKTKLITGLLVASVLCVGAAAFTACGETAEDTTYTVTYVGGSGATGTAPTEKEHKKGETFVVAENTFAKTDFTFTTWSDGTNTYAPGATYTMGDKNVTFTAQWTASTPAPAPDEGEYTVSYNFPNRYGYNLAAVLKSGKFDEGDTVTIPTLDLDAINLSGHTIIFNVGGKIDETDGATIVGGTFYEAGDTFEMPAHNVTILVDVIAPNEKDDSEYDVEFDLDGGSWATGVSASSFAATVTVLPEEWDDDTDGYEYVLPTGSDLAERAHYTFLGWQVNTSNGWEDIYVEYADPDSGYATEAVLSGADWYVVNGKVTFRPVWSPNEYTVAFDLGEGAADTAAAIDSMKQKYDLSITLPAGPEAADGYTFLGWKAEGESENHGGGTSYTVKGNVTLVAQWTQETTYTVSYDIPQFALWQLGTAVPAPAQYLTGAEVTIAEIVLSGYTTSYTVGTTEYAAGDTITVGTEDVTIVVDFEAIPITYIPEFDLDGGSWVGGAVTEFGEPEYDSWDSEFYRLPDAAKARKEGYTLVGWQVYALFFGAEPREWLTVEDLTEDGFVFYLDSDDYLVETDSETEFKVMFKAIWEENTYTVSFENDGSAVSGINDVEGKKDVVVSLPTLTTEDASFVFAGWTDGTDTYTDEYIIKTSNVTLSAVWKTVSTSAASDEASKVGEMVKPWTTNATYQLQNGTKMTFDSTISFTTAKDAWHGLYARVTVNNKVYGVRNDGWFDDRETSYFIDNVLIRWTKGDFETYKAMFASAEAENPVSLRQVIEVELTDGYVDVTITNYEAAASDYTTQLVIRFVALTKHDSVLVEVLSDGVTVESASETHTVLTTSATAPAAVTVVADHEHEFGEAGAICLCGTLCKHENVTDGVCGICGATVVNKNVTTNETIATIKQGQAVAIMGSQTGSVALNWNTLNFTLGANGVELTGRGDNFGWISGKDNVSFDVAGITANTSGDYEFHGNPVLADTMYHGYNVNWDVFRTIARNCVWGVFVSWESANTVIVSVNFVGAAGTPYAGYAFMCEYEFTVVDGVNSLQVGILADNCTVNVDSCLFNEG